MQKKTKKVMDVAKESHAFVGIAVVIFLVLVAYVLLTSNFRGRASVVYTTTVLPTNLTIAVGPNLASCNGYNVSIGQYTLSNGYCGWRGGRLNITIFGGSYANTALHIQQVNASSPINATYYAATCATNNVVQYLPVGNFKISFATGLSAGSCGLASVRFSTS